MSPATNVDGGQLVGGHDLAQPARIAAEVEGRDRRALADERPDRPGADAARGRR